VQVKTFSQDNIKPKHEINNPGYNGLERYSIKHDFLDIKEDTLDYWHGLGMPVYLFVIIYPEFDCYYKRFTPILTTQKRQDEEYFYKVSDGRNFLAFKDQANKTQGFARDLYVDLMRCSYYKGSISYISPRTIGLQQFPNEEFVFQDLIKEYQENVCRTYIKTRRFLEQLCLNYQTQSPELSPYATCATASPSPSQEPEEESD